jgi:hypothetical protein
VTHLRQLMIEELRRRKAASFKRASLLRSFVGRQ